MKLYKDLTIDERGALEASFEIYNIQMLDLFSKEPSITLTNGTIIYIEGVEQ